MLVLTSQRSSTAFAPLSYLLHCPPAAPLRVLSCRHEVCMFDIKKDIQAMTTFRRNPGEFMKRLKKTKRPLILTVNGKAEAVVQDAEAYQRLLDIAAQADAVEGIRQGLEDAKKGRMRPAREVLEMFRRVHEIPR
jgi:prevent-host-death family protein